MSIKGVVPVEFDDFSTPNFAKVRFKRSNNDSNPLDMPVPISAIPDDTFHSLVNRWVREMYKEAGKQMPPIAA